MKIQVLGSGCPSCKNLHQTVIKIVNNLNLVAELEYSTDVSKIVELGVMTSPVLVINDELVSAGKVPNKSELEKIISERIQK